MPRTRIRSEVRSTVRWSARSNRRPRRSCIDEIAFANIASSAHRAPGRVALRATAGAETQVARRLAAAEDRLSARERREGEAGLEADRLHRPGDRRLHDVRP